MTAQTARFWNKKAQGYAAKPLSDVQSYEEMLTEIGRHLSADDNVLEIGCGTGSTAVRMAEQVASWTASDISSEMIRIAKGKSAPDNTEFVVADADSSFEKAPFDVVCAFHILHLVPDTEQTLKSLFNQLKPGGLFISKTVCPGDMGIMPRLVLPAMTLFRLAPPNVHLLQRASLTQMVKRAGFEIIEQKTFGGHTAAPFIVARRPA